MSGLISAAVTRLRAALAAITGGGLMGYSSAENYPANTIGAGLKAEEAARASAVSGLAATVGNNATTAAAATAAVAQDLADHEAATVAALAGKAATGGNSAQAFEVAPATQPEHAVALGQFSYEKVGTSWKTTRPDGVVEIGQEYISTGDTPQVFEFPFGGFDNECWGVQVMRLDAGAVFYLGVVPGSITASGFSVDRDDSIDGSRPFVVRAIGR